MFRGSLPQDVQRIFSECVLGWNTDTVHVGCSGNFTVERVLSSLGGFGIHSNDVTLYSSIFGAFLAKQSFRIELKPDTGFEWLADYMKTPIDQCATVALATRLTDGMKTTGEIKENVYYERMTKAYQNQFARLHGLTTKKVENLKLDLLSYFCGDVMDFVDQVPQSGSFVVYPPFYAGDYTNMFKKLDILFDWDHPKFGELTDEIIATLYQKVTQKKHWLFGTDTLQEAYAENLIGLAKTTNRGVPMYLYASSGKKRIVMPEQKTEPVNNSRLMPNQEIGKRISLALLNYKQFQSLRSQYMNAFIRPGQATEAYGVLVDGYLCGVFAISAAPNPGAFAEPSTMYMLSDFPVAPTDYPRLSKLVLYCALSKEAKLFYERVTKRRIRYLYTTAFSDHYESMKYRGIFKLHNRHENEMYGKTDDPHNGRRFIINYLADVGKWTLAEGFQIWKTKHGVKDANENKNYLD